MKHITLEQLPEIITEEVFNVLVEMVEEFPKKTFDWRDISLYLRKKDLPTLMKILNKVSEPLPFHIINDQIQILEQWNYINGKWIKL